MAERERRNLGGRRASRARITPAGQAGAAYDPRQSASPPPPQAILGRRSSGVFPSRGSEGAFANGGRSRDDDRRNLRSEPRASSVPPGRRAGLLGERGSSPHGRLAHPHGDSRSFPRPLHPEPWGVSPRAAGIGRARLRGNPGVAARGTKAKHMREARISRITPDGKAGRLILSPGLSWLGRASRREAGE